MPRAGRQGGVRPVDVAASLGVSAQTACGALRALAVREGDVVAISAAAGGVGSLATQLAVQRGATVIGVASPDSAEKLKAWGAIPVSYRDDLATVVAGLAPSPVTKFLDCYGGDYVRTALALGVEPRHVATLAPSPAVLLRGVRFTGSRDAQPGDLEMVARGVAHGSLEFAAVRVVSFEEAAVRAAYADLLAGRIRGKVVVEISRRGRQSDGDR